MIMNEESETPDNVIIERRGNLIIEHVFLPEMTDEQKESAVDALMILGGTPELVKTPCPVTGRMPYQATKSLS